MCTLCKMYKKYSLAKKQIFFEFNVFLSPLCPSPHYLLKRCPFDRAFAVCTLQWHSYLFSGKLHTLFPTFSTFNQLTLPHRCISTRRSPLQLPSLPLIIVCSCLSRMISRFNWIKMRDLQENLLASTDMLCFFLTSIFLLSLLLSSWLSILCFVCVSISQRHSSSGILMTFPIVQRAFVGKIYRNSKEILLKR